ncbi:hypothetical protein ACHAXA_009735 [Cyclostephanos tholiformis]|uniref:PiggyBac transposable element-derived protein domain-containing protein n=1 Tax=Cyclostephanos tholiformis TaxID=382380 RepID=A0ABD3R8Z9_9STRA
MVSTSKPGGIGAIGSVASRLFHPGDKVREKYPKDAKLRCVNVEITDEGLRRIKNEAKMCYLVSIPEVQGECYIAKKHFRVEQGPDTPFESERAPLRRDIPRPRLHGEDRTALVNVVCNVGNGVADEVLELRAQGLEVNDDNEPLDEGTGAPPPLEYNGPHNFTVPTHCPRRERNMIDERGKWVSHRWDEIASMSEFELFRMAFLEDFVKDVIIPRTNDNLGSPLMLGEFYKWLRCNFFMACFQGIPDRKCWWSKEAISPYSGAPFRLNNAMSFTRYLEITAALRFTDVRMPTVERDGYEDRFHEVRKMIDEFNNHYAHSYHPSWLNCLDESMSSWLNKFCPGFMCVPRKPHPFGNEYHSIADGDDGKSIMWRVKLVEGKDRPKKAGGQWVFPTEFPGYGKTTTTMLEMTKPIHGKGKVVGDSGFCVREGVVECHKRGVWFQAYVKKRGNWPRGVPGAAIDMYFDDMELGHCESLVAEHDNVPFLIHCCRDSKYVSKIMSTHGMLETVQDHPTWWKIDGSWKSFKYTEPFSRYARAKHWVDDVNNRHHDPIGLEEVWGTKWWAMRQFTFLCSVAEVNAVQSRARGKNEVAEPQLQFRRELARQMIENTLDDPPTPEPRTNADHALKKRAAFEGNHRLRPLKV